MTFPPLKVAICTVPGMIGHLVPLIPMAQELVKRGHHVTLFHDAHGQRHKLEECSLVSGVQSVTYKEGEGIYDSVLAHYKYYHSQHAGTNNKKNATTRNTPKQNADSSSCQEMLPPRHVDAPDVLVYDFFAVDSADAADTLGIPAVGVFPNPRSINPWAVESPTWCWKLWNSCLMWPLEGVLARLLWTIRNYRRSQRGLPLLPEQDLYPSPHMPRTMIGSTSELLEFPNLPAAPRYHMVGPAGLSGPLPSDDLQEWLDAQESCRRPIVYVAFGTQYRYTPTMVRKLQADLASLRDEHGNHVAVLWSLPKQGQQYLLQQQHAHWKVANFLPQVAILQGGQLAAFVTHCGSNSLYESLLAGVPMVACPGWADQPANATRMVRAGVGRMGTHLRTALQQVLGDPQMTANARALAQKLHENNAAEQAADIIERVAREGFMDLKDSTSGRFSLWPLIPLLGIAIPLLLVV